MRKTIPILIFLFSWTIALNSQDCNPDTIPPTVTCQNISVELDSSLTYVLHPSEILVSAFDNCVDTEEIRYKIQHVDASDNPLGDAADSLILTCDEIRAYQFVRLWAFDGDPADSNSDYCISTIDVVATDDYDCSVGDCFGLILPCAWSLDNRKHIPIHYEIRFDNGHEVKEDCDQLIICYDQPGTVCVTSTKKDDYLEGVTSWDIIQIRKHLLNRNPFEHDYLKLAADINGDGRVSTLDILHLRRAILGVVDTFPSGHSWVIINGEPSDSLEVNCKRQSHLWPGDEEDFDWRAIKVGDLSGDINPR